MNSPAPHQPLSADQLAIGYDTTIVARDLQLALRAGEFVCLLGPNGAGKSTLIRTLSGMQPPLSGQLHLGDQEFKDIQPRTRARKISVVLTESLSLGRMDAYSLVALGRHPYSGWLGGLNAKDHTHIAAALKAVGASELAHRSVAELSDGERQKVSIARALAQEARVMLLDEPTAFLDLPRRVELMTLLRDLAHREQMALLLSTHDLDLALRFADRLWILTKEGKLVQGFPEALALSGDFAEAFASENLDWDAELGSFRAHPIACLKVRLEGSGLPAVWTRRVLTRLGFGIAEADAVSAFSIRISEAANTPAWQITRDQNTLTMHSLQELIEWIQTQKWRAP